MREIKFRAWINQKYMVYPDAPDCPCDQWPGLKHWFKLNMAGDLISGTDKGETYARIGHAWELMQFTGLLDKNGKEIYESDLVEVSFPIYKSGTNEILEYGKEVGVVTWMQEYAAFWVKLAYTSEELIEEENMPTVVGNVFQHPELLSGK